MAKRKSSTDTPAYAAGLQVTYCIGFTSYIGTREEILSTGILTADLLPKKIHDHKPTIVHDGRRIRCNKYGYGTAIRWELIVVDRRDYLLSPEEFLKRFGDGVALGIHQLRLNARSRINGLTIDEAHNKKSRTGRPRLSLILGGRSN